MGVALRLIDTVFRSYFMGGSAWVRRVCARIVFDDLSQPIATDLVAELARLIGYSDGAWEISQSHKTGRAGLNRGIVALERGLSDAEEAFLKAEFLRIAGYLRAWKGNARRPALRQRAVSRIYPPIETIDACRFVLPDGVG